MRRGTGTPPINVFESTNWYFSRPNWLSLHWQADAADIDHWKCSLFMWDSSVCPKTTEQIPPKCFLMTGRFKEIYRGCWYYSKCPPLCPKSPTRMQTTAVWTAAKLGCKLGNRLRQVHIGSIHRLETANKLQWEPLRLYCQHIVLFYLCTWMSEFNVHVHISVSGTHCTWQSAQSRQWPTVVDVIAKNEHQISWMYLALE